MIFMVQIRGMHTLIRDHEISTTDFVFYSDRLIRLVLQLFVSFLEVNALIGHLCTGTTQVCMSDLFYLNFQVVEHGLGHLPFTEKQVVTPTGLSVNKLIVLSQFSSS